jgi:hypothetical protein
VARKPLPCAASLYWKVVPEFAQVGSVNASAAATVLVLLALSCKASPGGSCAAHEARCLDARRALICDDGKFVETPCRGKGGCSTVLEKTSCDISGNQPGDPCGAGEEGVAVCAGPSAMLACHGRKYETVPCRGPKGCETLGAQASCDQSVAEVGEACKKQHAKACSVDHGRVLSCDDGRMLEQYFCRGEGRCSSAGGKLACDQTVARLGDHCDKSLNGHVACSEDKKSLIVCQDERFVASEKCKAGTVCTVAGQSTSCERP